MGQRRPADAIDSAEYLASSERGERDLDNAVSVTHASVDVVGEAKMGESHPVSSPSASRGNVSR
jgi:hypothetical protein